MSAAGEPVGHPLVYVVLVNWNGWADSVECLESLFRSDYPHYRVVLCDNGSSDGSLDKIKAWAEGRLVAEAACGGEPGRLSSPPIEKPLAYREYARLEAEGGGSAGAAPLTLVRVGENLGFAGGNNVGLRFALSRGDFSFVWLLNNDTVVTPDTLGALVRRMRQSPGAGICGSKLLYYRDPGVIQGLGGARYNRWLGTNRHLGYLEPDQGSRSRDVAAGLDYVIGASMLVTRSFLEQIGLMSEEYFLYFEELDWAYRARGRFGLAYAADSVVYHKEGGSAGTGAPETKGRKVDYFVVRSRLLFTWKFVPWALPTIYLGLVCILVNRMRRGQWDRIPMILGLALSSRRRLLTLKQFC